MTFKYAYLVRRTFGQLEAYREVAALVFFRRLFELDPEWRARFQSDINEESRRLMDTLAALITLLEQPGTLADELRALGTRHASCGINDDQYATVHTALLDTLALTLAAEFTPETQRAWSSLFAQFESAMKSAAREAREAGLSPA